MTLKTSAYMELMEDASAYLAEVSRVRHAMKRAEVQMLKMRDKFSEVEHRTVRKRLARAHKALVKRRKAWNRVEEIRGSLF